MKKKKRTLVGDLLDVTVATAISGPTFQIIGASSIPEPLKSGTSSLVGIGLFKGAAKITK